MPAGAAQPGPSSAGPLSGEALHASYLAECARETRTNRLVPWQTSPADLAGNVASLAVVTPADVVVDIGCGDGTLLLEVVRRTGAAGLGLDISSVMVQQARANAEARGLGGRCAFRVDDVLAEGWRLPAAATVVYLYFMLPAASQIFTATLRTALAARPGLRVLTFQHHPDAALLRPAREDLFGLLRLFDGGSVVPASDAGGGAASVDVSGGEADGLARLRRSADGRSGWTFEVEARGGVVVDE